MRKKFILISTIKDYEEMSLIRDNDSEDCIVLLNYMEDLFSVQKLFAESNDKHAIHITGWLTKNGEYLNDQYHGNFEKKLKNEDGSIIMNYYNGQYISDYYYHDDVLRLVFIRNEKGQGKERLYLDQQGNVVLKTRIHWDEIKKKYITDCFEFKFDGRLEKLNSESEFIEFFLNHILTSVDDILIIDGEKYTETLINYETNLQKVFYVNEMNKRNLLMTYEYSNSGIKVLVKSDKTKDILLKRYYFPKNSVITYLDLRNDRFIRRPLQKIVGVLTDGVSPKAGGLTGALYKRIKFLQQMGYQPILLTFANQNSDKLYEESVRVGRAIKNPVYNLWSFLRSRSVFFESRTEKINSEMLELFNKELSLGITDISIIEQKSKNDKIIKFSYIKDKIYKFKGFSENSVILKETFKGEILQKREYYNKDGIKVRQTTLSDGKVEDTESFYNEGRLFLTTGRKFSTARHKYLPTWYEIPLVNGTKRFQAYYELQIYFMTRHFAYANTVLFVEHPAIYTAVSNWKTEHQINVVFHSTHLTYGTNKLKGAYNNVVTHLGDNINQIIVLTKSAKSDLDSRVSVSKQKDIIIEPHTIEKKNILVPFAKRPDFTAISLGRLDKDKRVSDVIQAFDLVIKKFPLAQLVIYGEGPEKNNLIELVSKLGIQNNVKFMGFTHKTDEAFQNATVHLFASKFEGFGLTLLESLANGTPNIAYAVDYGPREFVNSEELVKDGNISNFSDKILEFFNHPDEKIQRSEQAIKFSGRYTDKDYFDQLKGIVESGFID